MSNTAVLIAGDGSDRQFYRDQLNAKSCIIMQYPSWDGGHGGTPERWLACQESLRMMGILVPDIQAIKKDDAKIYTEDLGDQTLEILFQKDKPSALKFYETALEDLVKVQEPLSFHAHPGEELAFDEEKLWYEMTFFETHFLNGLCKNFKQIWQSDWTLVKKELLALCQYESQMERVLCHRDYHSRNLMVHNEKLYWIDFQDMRMGPKTYDVASLLRDSYVHLSQEEQAYLFEFYLSTLNKRREEKNKSPLTHKKLRQEFVIVAWQRQLKALGSFGYLSIQKEKPLYTSYVRPTLKALCETYWREESEQYLPDLSPNLGSFAQKLYDIWTSAQSARSI